MGATLRAQDVSLAPLEWVDPRDTPEELPTIKSVPKIPFPEEMRATSDFHYLAMRLTLDSSGRVLGVQQAATTPRVIRVYQESVVGAVKFSPARRSGKPVNSEVSTALLFNPASSAANRPEAGPRLLAAAPVSVPRPRGTAPGAVIDDRVVTLEIVVDESGRIARIKDAPPEHARRIEIAAKNWLFAPARKGGVAVAAEVRVPFVLVTATDEPRPTTPPKVIAQEKPVYPFAMRASGMRGEVHVEFIVDIEGRVRNASVVRSLNSAFEEPALKAVRKWRFEPARVAERPVPIRMQVPIVFALFDAPEGGSDGLSTLRKADLSKLPEELRYDKPPRPTGMVRAVYPYDALAAGRTGAATVDFLVDENGRVARARVREASAPEFGRALLAAVQQFTYEPAVKAGRPSKAMLGFRQEFNREESLQLVAGEDLSLLARERKRPQSIMTPSELDEKLVPISQRAPVFPLTEQGPAGEALIEALIDEEGRVRLPRAVSATSEAFAEAAISGVAHWRFEPPTRGGKPVVARVRIPVMFRVQPAPDAIAEPVDPAATHP